MALIRLLIILTGKTRIEVEENISTEALCKISKLQRFSMIVDFSQYANMPLRQSERWRLSTCLDKYKCGGIYTVSLPGGIWTVVENVTQM